MNKTELIREALKQAISYWGWVYAKDNSAAKGDEMEPYKQALATLEGCVVLPREPTEQIKKAIISQQPVRTNYWVEDGELHCEVLDPLPPENTYNAMIKAAEGSE